MEIKPAVLSSLIVHQVTLCEFLAYLYAPVAPSEIPTQLLFPLSRDDN